MRTRSNYHNLSGIPLGGIGTGSFEIRGDGRFYEWHIFNNGEWALRTADRELEYMDKNDFFIALRIKPKDGEPIIRLLGAYAGETEHGQGFAAFPYMPIWYGLGGNPYSAPWIRPVDEVEMRGEPPLTFLKYTDKDLPLNVEVEFLSPFVPGDSRNSAIPAVIVKVKLTNKMEQALEASVIVGLKNPLAFKFKGTKAKSRVVEVENTGSAIDYVAEEMLSTCPLSDGSITLLATGPREEFTFRVGVPKNNESLVRLWVDVRNDGAVEGPRESVDTGEAYGIVCRRLNVKDEAEATFVLSWFFPGFYDSQGERIGHAYENWFKNSLEVAAYVAKNMYYLYGYTRRFHDLLYNTSLEGWLIDLIASQITTLVKSTHYTKDMIFGIWEGYGCCGLNTTDVAFCGSYMILQLFPDIEKKWLSYHAGWQLKPGLFPYYELYALAYPENMAKFKEKIRSNASILTDPSKLSESIAAIVAETGKDPRGRIHHFFTGSFKTPDAYHMVDVMPKFILMVFRDALWTGDPEFVKKLWANLKDAAECTLRDDPLGLLLPYHTTPAGFETFWNLPTVLKGLPEMFARTVASLLQGYTNLPVGFQTFDAWSFLGVSAYASLIWVTALEALENAAELVGDEQYKAKLSSIRKEATGNILKLLWNGDYFDLWFDPVSGMRDKACLSSQLMGLWYSPLCNLPYPIDKDMAKKTLRNVFKNCFKPGEGLINGVYPDGKRPSCCGDLKYSNETGLPYRVGCQMDTPWTGMELAVASQMIYEGMLSEAIAILRELHERYCRYGLYWNHLECGGHYYRSMASWGVLAALEGLTYDGFNLKLEFRPKVNKEAFKGLFTVAGSWGVLTQNVEKHCQKIGVETVKNTLRIRKIVVEKLGDKISSVEAYLDGSKVECSHMTKEDEVEITFEREASLGEGSILSIDVHYGD
ncbi:MAG: GH116 family glycosyl hydrolase [Thermoproteota archaeon]